MSATEIPTEWTASVRHFDERAGLPVPAGFLVGASAFAAFCEESGLRAKLAAELGGLDVDDAEALAVASAHARALVTEAPMPAWLEVAIATAYGTLEDDDGPAPVAVSSATAEDTEPAPFARTTETFVNVRGASNVVDAVRHCWASLFGGRAILHRARRGLSQADMDVAVIVQRLFPSTRAGVMLTIDPASGRADWIVIDGS
jgi:pyruvate,water dikinase